MVKQDKIKVSLDQNLLGQFIMNLQLLFIGLKLAGFISWSWTWVLFPIWVQLLLAFLLIVLGLFIK